MNDSYCEEKFEVGHFAPENFKNVTITGHGSWSLDLRLKKPPTGT